MRYRCPFCRRGSFSRFEDLQKHVRAGHATPLCPVCNAGEDLLGQHARSMSVGAFPGDTHRILYGLLAPSYLGSGYQDPALEGQCVHEALQACEVPTRMQQPG